jgi:hypothetical protein
MEAAEVADSEYARAHGDICIMACFAAIQISWRAMTLKEKEMREREKEKEKFTRNLRKNFSLLSPAAEARSRT